MKTIIISDIKSNKDSVITYGLRLAKQLETEAEVMHPIDPRVHQGAYGAVSDSQSVTPGSTFSHEEAIFREKEGVKKDLDKLLSAEASRLNYPLKVEVQVEQESINEAVKNKVEKNNDNIFVISAEPDGKIFHSKPEILETIKNNRATCLIVPPGNLSISLKKILIPVDFHASRMDTLSELHPFFQKIRPYIVAVDVAENGNYTEKELKSQNWKELASDILPHTKISTVTLEGDDYSSTIAAFCNRNTPDLFLIALQKQNPVKRIFSKNGLEKLIYKVNVPILFYHI